MTSKQEITGLVLCGGAGRRIGGQDKGLAPFRGTPLVEHVIKRLQPQVGQIILSANRNLSRYQTWGFPVFPDTDCSGQGPLSGILTGLLRCDSPCLAIVPCDAPFLPGDLVTRLCGALLQQRADVALAHDGARGWLRLTKPCGWSEKSTTTFSRDRSHLSSFRFFLRNA